MAYFPDSIYLIPYPSPYPNIPVIRHKRVEFFHYLNLNCVTSLSSQLASVYQSFSFIQEIVF